MPLLEASPWILCPRPKAAARLTVIALPYAGGGAGIYRGWAERLPPSIDLAAVRLPGREARLAEPALRSVDALADAVVTQVVPRVRGPFALFGHSLGGLVAYEAARGLRARGRAPARLIVSAAPPPPSCPGPRRLSGLPDRDLRREVAALGATPAVVLESDELWELVSPTLRADFAACETYRWEPGPPIDVPLTVLGGIDDPDVTADDLAAWAALTCGPTTITRLPGDHFFAFADAAATTRAFAAELDVAAAVAA